MWRTARRRTSDAKGCLTLAKKIWNWSPHPKQRALFCDPSQVRVAACGRRWGKTESLSVDLASLAVLYAKNNLDCRQLVVAPTETQARLIGAETLRLLLDAQSSPEMNGILVNIRQRPCLQVTLHRAGTDPNSGNDKKARVKGSCISLLIFRTAGRDGRSLRGLWAHRLVVDEAGYVPDSVISEVLLPMLTDVGGDLVMASSPAGRRSAFYRMFGRGLSFSGKPDEHGLTYSAFQCPSTDNPHINKAFLSSMLEELGENRFAQEFLAQFVDDFGSVFRADDIDQCIAEDAAVASDNGNLVSLPLDGHVYSVGIDWGRKLDYTVVAILDATTPPARLVYLYRMQGTSWEAQAKTVGQLLASFAPIKINADGNSIGDPVAEQLQASIITNTKDGERVPQVNRFMFAGESKTMLIDSLTCALSARALTYPQHRVLLSELRNFEYLGTTSTGRFRMAAKGSGHDDTVMALALAWLCAPDGPAPSPSSVISFGSSLGATSRDDDMFAS